MEIYKEMPRQKKNFKVNHSESGDFWLDYILLPFGYLYNADIANAKKGDTIQLFNGGKYSIVSCRKIRIKSPEADLLSRMRYGITIAGALSRWKTNARLEGHGAQAISEDECLWIVFEKLE